MSKNIQNMLSRGVVTNSDPSKKLQTLQISLLADERKDGVEHFEPYGFTSNPPDGAEVVCVFLDGDRSHGIVPVATDRRVRIKALPKGAIGIGFDNNAQIIIDPDNTMTIHATTINVTATNLNMTASNIHSQGSWTHTGDITADGISAKHHTHGNVQSGSGNTGQPQ